MTLFWSPPYLCPTISTSLCIFTTNINRFFHPCLLTSRTGGIMFPPVCSWWSWRALGGSWQSLLCGLEEQQGPLPGGGGGDDNDDVDDVDDEFQYLTGWFIRLFLRSGSIWVFGCIVHFKCALSIIKLVNIIKRALSIIKLVSIIRMVRLVKMMRIVMLKKNT